MINVDDNNFKNEVENSDKPVVIDFFADWCGPCKTIEPMFRDLAEDFYNKVKFGRCNVDENKILTSAFSIRSVPTFIFFKDGEVDDIVVGTPSKLVFREKINRMM
jgi:thioredoxin 1